MSKEQFEQWALDPQGGGWTENPTKQDYPNAYKANHPEEIWEEHQKAFTAGVEAERKRLRALVEAWINELEAERYPAKINLKEFNIILNYLTDPTPETDKTETA